MTLNVFITFLTTSILLALAPGPDILFVLAQSCVFGAKAGIFIVFGLLTGIVLQTLAAAFGVAAVVAASPFLYWGIRVLGALYLLYLAWMSWMHPVAGEQKTQSFKSMKALYRRGLIMNVTNPKVQIFFLAFFPQFVAPSLGFYETALQMFLLGATFAFATFVVMGSVAFLAGSLSDYLRNEKVQFYLNRIASLVFLGLAIGVFFS